MSELIQNIITAHPHAVFAVEVVLVLWFDVSILKLFFSYIAYSNEGPGPCPERNRTVGWAVAFGFSVLFLGLFHVLVR